MGCTSSVMQTRSLSSLCQSPIGILSISIGCLHIDSNHPLFKNRNSRLSLNISNHQFHMATDLVQKQLMAGKTTQFQCFINSVKKKHGRVMLVSLSCDQQQQHNQVKAFGIVDLEPFLNGTNQRQIVKCRLNMAQNCVGYIDVNINFFSLQFKRFKFIVNDFFLQKTVTNSYCTLTAGEQILQLNLQLTKKSSWSRNPLQFYLAKGLQKVKLQIYQKNKDEHQIDVIIGEGLLNLRKQWKFLRQDTLRIQIFHSGGKIGYLEIKLIQKPMINKDWFVDQSQGLQSTSRISLKSKQQIVTQVSTGGLATKKQIPPQKSKSNLTSLHNIVQRITPKKPSSQIQLSSVKLITQPKYRLNNKIQNEQNIADQQDMDFHTSKLNVTESFALTNQANQEDIFIGSNNDVTHKKMGITSGYKRTMTISMDDIRIKA